MPAINNAMEMQTSGKARAAGPVHAHCRGDRGRGGRAPDRGARAARPVLA